MELELRGLYRFDDVAFMPAEPAILPDGWPEYRRPPLGKYRELVLIRFGLYDLEVQSPVCHPPLGLIMLTHADGVETGPLDSTVWKRIGKFIRHRERKLAHVDVA